MRNLRSIVASALAVGLVVALAPSAFASVAPAARRHSTPVPKYKVSKPHVLAAKVKTGVTFEASGSVTPTITDASTTVSVEVFKLGARGGPRRIALVPATLSTDASGGTRYTASLSYADAGTYRLDAVALRGSRVVGKSASTPMKAYLPYKVTMPRIARPAVKVGVAFNATGSVVPTLTAEDASATLTIQVWKFGKRHNLIKVAEVAGSFIAGPNPAGKGTGYVASLSLPSVGKFRLVAVVSDGAAVLGRSLPRQMQAKRN